MTTNTYLIKEGYNNLNKHGSKTISTMLIICATMLILGIFIIILQNVNQNVQTLRLEQGLQAFIEDKSTDEDVAYMEDQIKLIDGVSQVQYMSKSEAYEDAKQQFKDQDYFLDGLEGLDIFPASFIVKFTNIEEADTIKAAVEKIANNMLENKEQSRNVYEFLFEQKITNTLKSEMKPKTQSVTTEEFAKIISK